MTYSEIKVKIDSLKQQVETQGGVNSEQLQKLYHKYRLECNYFSNYAEGNTLEKEEVRSMIDGLVTVDKKPLKDLMEIKKHDEVLKELLGGSLVDSHLSEKYIKELHAKLMYEEDSDRKAELGQWKQTDNSMSTYKGEKYTFVAASAVKKEMRELINRTNEAIDYILKGKKYAPHPIDVALNFHVDFLKVSPFARGNGLVARLLSNQILIAFVYTPFWITDKEQELYVKYLTDVLCYDEPKDDLFTHIGQQILRSQQMIVDIQEGKSIEESEKFYNQIEMLKRQLKAKEEEKSKVKSAEWLESIFVHSIRPLFTEVELQVLESFGDLFGEIEGQYTLDVSEEEILEEEVLVNVTQEGEEETIATEKDASAVTEGDNVEDASTVTEGDNVEDASTVTEEDNVEDASTVQEEDLAEELPHVFDLDNPHIAWDRAEEIHSVIRLGGFKLIEGAAAIEVGVSCRFTELTYVIDLGDGTVFEKEYDQQLETAEIKAVTDYTCETIVKKINAL